MLLAYSGIEHDLILHKEEDDGTWFEDKKPLLAERNALANLPYLEMDDGLVVCESKACLMYLQECLSLGPTDGAARIQSYALLSAYMSTRSNLVNRSYFHDVIMPPPCPMRELFAVSIPALLATGPFSKYEACLRMSRTAYFCGGTPCACHFVVWEMLDQYATCAADLGLLPPLVELPLFTAFHERVRETPELAANFDSSCLDRPMWLSG